MIKPTYRYRFAIALVVCATVMTAQAQSDFECPDSAVEELARVAMLYGPHISYGTTTDRYKYVIENATRPMDDHALRSACYLLANHYFRTNCSDYGYECPHPGRELQEWPASMNTWIDKLKSQYPILRQCPEKSIYRDDKLPIVRVSPVPSPEVLAQKLTGWVELKVDIDAEGKVEKVILVNSTSKLLEASSIEAARRFKYRPKVDENYLPIAESGVTLTIHTDYSDLAKSSGCASE
jgi:TonB family protein